MSFITSNWIVLKAQRTSSKTACFGKPNSINIARYQGAQTGLTPHWNYIEVNGFSAGMDHLPLSSWGSLNSRRLNSDTWHYQIYCFCHRHQCSMLSSRVPCKLLQHKGSLLLLAKLATKWSWCCIVSMYTVCTLKKTCLYTEDLSTVKRGRSSSLPKASLVICFEALAEPQCRFVNIYKI